MTTVIAVRDVDDVAGQLSSPKRAEFFNAHGMTVRTFVDPRGRNRVGVIIENVPSLEALTEALQGADAAAVMKHDGVHPDTLEIFVASQPAIQDAGCPTGAVLPFVGPQDAKGILTGLFRCPEQLVGFLEVSHVHLRAKRATYHDVTLHTAQITK